jgi:hypothetical protein
MTRPQLEVAEIFRRFGPAWRAANAGHLSLAQRRVMRAVELCRTAELGGHVEQCADCAHIRIAYNSCRNRHCPKCQWGAAQAWLEAREAELLPVPYFHVVFTLPAALGALAYQNKARGAVKLAERERICRRHCSFRTVNQAARATPAISRQVWKARSRAARWSLAVRRWRTSWKRLWIWPWLERNRWAWRADLNRCICRSRRRVGWCETSARLFR